MDTSIIVVIAIAVVFVVVVPALVRRSATELSRVDLDRVPDDARVIRADSHTPCRDEAERVTVFRSETNEPAVPRPRHTSTTAAPTLRLSVQTPELSVIDGLAEVTPQTQRTPETAVAPLPAAVGETGSVFVAADHDPADPRALHPAVRAVFAQTGSGPRNPGPTSSGADAATSTVTTSGSSAATTPRTRAPRSGSAQRSASPNHSTHPGAVSATTPSPSPGGGDRLGEGAGTTTHPTNRSDEDLTMTDSGARLRESLRSIGAMVRGFALVFLASVLGVLVTGVLALLTVVHPALIGVFAGLAVVSLFIVRTLNLRKREIKRRLRGLSTHPAEESSAPRAAASTSVTHRGSASTSAAPTSATPRSATERAAAPTSATQRATARTSAVQSADSAGVGAAKSDSARSRPGKSGSTGAMRARAVMQRSANAKYAREEALTGEIPIVHIRKEDTEGHTTRQILLTGPIPVIDETTAAPANADEGAPGGAADSAAPNATEDAPASAGSAASAEQGEETTEESLPATEVSPSAVTASPGLGDDLIDVVPVASADSADAETTAVTDPFKQRLMAREGWSPTPLPVPSYVDAAEAEHTVPETKAADASSYETEARSREDIAAQFAEELGYRNELSDSAREDSPLEHGRKAIRADRAPALDAVNDVLARRRA